MKIYMTKNRLKKQIKRIRYYKEDTKNAVSEFKEIYKNIGNGNYKEQYNIFYNILRNGIRDTLSFSNLLRNINNKNLGTANIISEFSNNNIRHKLQILFTKINDIDKGISGQAFERCFMKLILGTKNKKFDKRIKPILNSFVKIYLGTFINLCEKLIPVFNLELSNLNMKLERKFI